MNHSEVENAIVEYMNDAETLLMNASNKKRYVVLKIKQQFPDINDSDIENTIEVFIMVSKLSVKLSVNKSKNNNNCCVSM
jgi:hypothetical protein